MRGTVLTAISLISLACAIQPTPARATLIVFDYPLAGATTVGAKINAAGDVVGTVRDSSGVRTAFIRQANGTFSSQITDPGDNTGFTRGLDITNSGLIVGDYLHFDAATTVSTFHGYTYNGTTFTTYDVGGPVSTTLSGINELGHLTGTFGSNVQPNAGFLDTGSGAVGFSVAGATQTFGVDVNLSDTVVGIYTDASGATHGYRRLANGTITTFDVTGSTSTQTLGINDFGVIVGTFTDSLGASHGFVVDSSFNILAQIDVPGAFGTAVNGINNRGDLVGSFTDAQGTHGFISTTAVPEPSTLIQGGLGALALSGMALRRRRRSVGAKSS